MYCTYEYTWINIPDRLQISGLLQKKGRLQCEKWLLIDLSRRGRDRLRHTEWAVSAVARQRVRAEDPLKRRHYGATGQCRHPQIGWNRVPIQLILPYLKTFLVIGYQGTRVLIHTHVELAMRCYDYCFIVFVWLRPEPAFVLVLFVLWRAKDIATFSTNDSGSTGWCSSRNRGGVPKRCKTAWHIETCRTECRTVPYSGRWVLSVLYRFPGCYEHADSGWSKQTAVSFLAWKFGTRRAWVWIWSLKTWGSCEQVQLCQRRSWSWEVSGTQLQALDAADWGAKYWLSGARYG
jgi:hypothetical protein